LATGKTAVIGDWRMVSSEWWTAMGEWRVADGEWQMIDHPPEVGGYEFKAG
jgi:hypothetical protein